MFPISANKLTELYDKIRIFATSKQQKPKEITYHDTITFVKDLSSAVD